MAIVDEPFSIWRLFRSRRDQPARTEYPDRSGAEAEQARPSEPLASVDDADDGELAEAASLGDPTILKGFNYSVTRSVRAEDGDDLWVEHLLICNRCIGGDMFSITSYPKIAPDPSPYDGVAPGETVQLPPWSLRCIECGRATTLVDARIGAQERGSDGSRGGPPRPEPTEDSRAARVYVSLRYPADLEDLQDRAAKADIPPADLFEAIHVRGLAPDFEPIFEGWQASSPNATTGTAA